VKREIQEREWKNLDLYNTATATMMESALGQEDLKGRSPAVLAVTITMCCLSSVFVLFRMISRAAIVKKVSWDDYFMGVAWILAVGVDTAICYGASHGLGRHEVNVPSEWQSGLRKAIYAFTILYQPALMATKTSILAFYLTFSSANRTFRWACYVTLFVVNAGGLSLTMVTVFQCDPISAAFRVAMYPNAHCTNILTIYLSSIPLNIITDLVLLFLPLPVLTGMRLPRKQKIIVIVTFSFGIFVVAVDVVRISYLQAASMMRLAEVQSAVATDGSSNAVETDSSFFLAFSFMWSAIEVAVGIMVACVPGLKPLVARFIPNMLRDPHDPPSLFGSISVPNPELQKPVPPLSGEEHPGNLDPPSSAREEGPMDMLEFLTGRRDFARWSNPDNRRSSTGLDFLTTPDMMGMPPMERSATALTNTSRNTAPDSPAFFDFVNLKQKKSFVYMTHRESIYPIAVVTVLFFIWGFEYGLLDTLNLQFQTVASVTEGQALGIRSAYYCGYFLGPLTIGRLVLKNWGFRACFPVGLSIYAAGCLIFWPAAVLTSWPTFLVTNFIVGFGLSNLEVAANPFIALCGPMQYAEIRLNLSQGVQAIGSIIAPLVADKAFLNKTRDAPSLVSTQWAYLGIALATVALALVYYYIPLPEATDAELEDAAERMDGANKAKVGQIPLVWIVLGLAIWSQFCYVGAQEVNGDGFADFLSVVAPSYNEANFFAIAHTAFAVSRFLAAGLGFWIKPRVVLLGFYALAILFVALCTHFTGAAGVSFMTMAFFAEGPMFALIFVQGLRGQGGHTKTASVLLVSAISGGSLFSPIASVVASSGRGKQYSLWVAVAALAGGAVFAVALNASGRIRKLVDPIQDGTDVGADSRPSSIGSRASRALSCLSVGNLKRKEDVEWKERKASVSAGGDASGPGPGLGTT